MNGEKKLKVKIERPLTQGCCERRFDAILKHLGTARSAMNRPRTLKVQIEYSQCVITMLLMLGMKVSHHVVGEYIEVTVVLGGRP